MPWSHKLHERYVVDSGFATGNFALRRCAVWIAIAISFASLASATDAAAPKNILVLYSFTDRSLWDPFDDLKKSVRAHVPEPVNFFVEYLDSQRFNDTAYERGVDEALANAYRNKKIDLVIVAAYPALAFALRHRDEIAPGVPIVFSYVHASRLEQQKPPGVSGVTLSADIPGTVALALHLHPDTANVVAITGTSEFERHWLGETRQAMTKFPEIKFIEVNGYPMASLPSRLRSVPPHSVALFELIPLGSEQPIQGVFESLVATGKLFPTYCFFRNYCVGRGGIAGLLPDYAEQSERTSEIVARIFAGESPDAIRIEHDSGSRVSADWRELRRWKIPESELPPGSVVLYREPTTWERYENYIIGGIALVLLQTVLIISLLLERAHKRKAEMVLTESEKRFRLMADSTPSLIWMSNERGEVTYLNEQYRVFTGESFDHGLGDAWKAQVHPGDLHSTEQAIVEALQSQKSFSKEYRLLRQDGAYRWMLDVASPRFNGDGKFSGFIGSAVDVTDQKLAEDALKRAGGKLIEVQERERGRIARELHDDICQRLILLSLEIEQTNRVSEKDAGRKSLIEVQRHCSELAGDVQLLSHQLHSSKLEYLGLKTALRSFIREFSKQHRTTVMFTAESVPKALPADVSLCFFRIGQEALQNARKYSGVSEFSVRLEGNGRELRMEVSDAGAGFDMEAAKKQGGLGLVSMEERVKVVNGTLSVETGLNKGTRIVVCVPLPESRSDERGEQAVGIKGKERDDEATTYFAGR